MLGSFLEESLKIIRVIPSHSPLPTRSNLKHTRDYCQTMLEGIRQAQPEGLTLEQVKNPLAVAKKSRLFWNRQMAQEESIARLQRLVEEADTPE